MPTEAHGAGARTVARVKHAEPQLESEVLRKMLTRVCGVTQEGVNPAGHSNAPQIPTEQLSLHQPPLPAGAAPLCCPFLAAPICISSKSLTFSQTNKGLEEKAVPGALMTLSYFSTATCVKFLNEAGPLGAV